jgi:uracil-DNA glycosylase family protein
MASTGHGAARRAVAPAVIARRGRAAPGAEAKTPSEAKAPAEEDVPVEALIPPRPTVARLRGAAAGCRACRLWKLGTQTVFGEGAGAVADAIMLVGEQPGDQEDQQGHPFVGPAGALLWRAVEEAGLDRSRIYVTNAVKHFKWEPRGKRRIHKKPDINEMNACRPWLEAEIAAVRPHAIVCLGATATRAVLGPSVKVMQHRGQLQESALAPIVTVTVHPSSILRAPDASARRVAMEQFVTDLKGVARHVARRAVRESHHG